MLLPEGGEHRLQRLEPGQFLPAHDLDDRLPLPLAAGKGRRGGCPVACCLPPVLVLVTAPGRCTSLMLPRGTLAGLGCLAEGAQAVGNRRSGGSAGGGHLAPRRSEPFADRGKVSIVLPFRLQFLNPRV